MINIPTPTGVADATAGTGADADAGGDGEGGSGEEEFEVEEHAILGRFNTGEFGVRARALVRCEGLGRIIIGVEAGPT